jgi:hypothetical protein
MSNNPKNVVKAVAMKRRIQEQIYEDTKDMTPEEFIAYMRHRIAKSQFADFLKQVDPTQPQFDLSAKQE